MVFWKSSTYVQKNVNRTENRWINFTTFPVPLEIFVAVKAQKRKVLTVKPFVLNCIFERTEILVIPSEFACTTALLFLITFMPYRAVLKLIILPDDKGASQSTFEVNALKLTRRAENLCEGAAIGFDFTSWLAGKVTQAIRVALKSLFDTQLKTILFNKLSTNLACPGPCLENVIVFGRICTDFS